LLSPWSGNGMKTRLVIADDSPLYLELLTLVLTELAELDMVGIATDGREAVRLVLEREADVALLDVEMPILNGLDAAKEIRRQRPQTTVVLHSGALTEDLRRRAQHLGLTIFSKLELFGTIELLTAHRAPRAA